MLIERLVLASNISIDRNATGLIVAACEKLKTGTSTVDDLWPGKPRSLSSLLSDQVVFEEAQKEMWSLREASRAVQKLQSSLNAKMHFLQRTVYPAVLHHGLSKIPNEILERILSETLFEMKSSKPFSRAEYRKKIDSLRTLSLVNHRFHSLILHIPAMLIDARGNELCWKSSEVLRNRAHALLYTGRTFHSRVKDFADNLVTLSFQPGSHWTPQAEPLSVELLPRLEELKLEMCEDFLSAHQLPSLRRLTTSIESSRISKLAKVMPQLTHLTITTIISSPDSLALIALTLSDGVKLRHLHLSFKAERFRAVDFRGFIYAENSRCLSAMESLQIILEIPGPYAYTGVEPEMGETFAGAISAFIQSLDLPSLGSCALTLSKNQSYVTKLTPIAHHFISCIRRNECLRHFSFVTSASNDTDLLTTTDIQSWIHQIPGLQSLTLTNIRITTDDAYDSFADMTTLRDITMESCMFEECSIKDFITWIFHASCDNIKEVKLIKMSEDHPNQLSQEINSLHRVLDQDFYAELTHGPTFGIAAQRISYA